MKRILLLLAILAGCSRAPEPEIPHWSAVELLRKQHEGELTDWDKLVLAIAYTESRFDPSATGTANDSGILQITEPYVREVNRLYKTEYTLEDAYDIDKSLEMYALMQGHYNQGRDIDEAIRLHNKSPYYRKAVLENLELINRMEQLRSKLCSGK